MPHWTDKYIAEHESALAVTRACKVPGCKFYVHRRKGGGGRGQGFREGNKQRGAMVQHLKTAHPELKPRDEWVVETLVGYRFENVWSVDGKPMTFATRREAVAELDLHFRSAAEAGMDVGRRDMDFRIRNLAHDN